MACRAVEITLLITPLLGAILAMLVLNWLVGGIATVRVDEPDLALHTALDPNRSWLLICDVNGRAGLALDTTSGHGIAVTQLGAHKVDHPVEAASLRIRIDRDGWRICLNGQPRTRVFKPWDGKPDMETLHAMTALLARGRTWSERPSREGVR